MKSNILLACCLTLLLPATAQEDTVSLKLDVVAWGPQVDGLSFKPGNKHQGVTALPFQYSKPIDYKGPPVIEIHQDPTAAAKTTEAATNAAPLSPELERRRKETPTLVALAKLPTGSKRATILIAPARAGTYQTVVIDDDPSKLPPGRLRIHNYCLLKIAMGFNGAKPRKLTTRQSIIVPPRQGHVVYNLAYELAGKWKKQEANLIPVGSDEQVQLIILKSDDDYFLSNDGSRSGFLQTVVLRRPANEDVGIP